MAAHENENIVSYYSWPSFEGEENRATDKNWIYEQHERINRFNNGGFTNNNSQKTIKK